MKREPDYSDSLKCASETHTPITDIIIHQTDNMFKPGIMYANTLHSVFLPETKYLSIRK